MIKPYIDQGTSENGEPEFSINGLTEKQALSIIASCLTQKDTKDLGLHLGTELAETATKHALKEA